ncbi:MAG: hypothetical protein DSY70_06365 [Desulfobulbus sp.]|nr:MAG: hypothetical protein DSY70_06365 [Desulfobulbus sp.]
MESSYGHKPLIVDLKEYEDELEDSIMIAMGLGEQEKADRYFAKNIAEIKGEPYSETPFRQVAELYNLPVKEVIKNIRDFTNKSYKENLMFGDPSWIKDIKFEPVIVGKE